jgi:hydrogenase maturation protein HypF
MKGAICLTKTGQALLSHHLGDLDDRLCSRNSARPSPITRSFSTMRPRASPATCTPDTAPAHSPGRWPGDRTPLTRVQHHHAHLASCLGEHLWPRDGGPVAGIILDGLGLGTDGTIWGGEVLLGDYAGSSARGCAPSRCPAAMRRTGSRGATRWRGSTPRGARRWPTGFCPADRSPHCATPWRRG